MMKKIIIWLLLIVVLISGVVVTGIAGVKKFIYPYGYKEIVEKYSKEYDLDPLLVLAVIKTESDFKQNAESHKGAKGLMQLMDDTGTWAASEVGIENFNPEMLFLPEVNIRLGCWYLENLTYEFGDLSLVLAAYNGGSGNVTRWLQTPEYSSNGKELEFIPFKETKKYVDKVKTNYNAYKYFYGKE